MLSALGVVLAQATKVATPDDVTGVLTFIVSRDGILYQKDLGPETESVARSMTRYNADQSWQRVAQQPD